MNTLGFVVGMTTWFSLLVIIFGLLTGFFDSNLTTWFSFVFLCAVGIGNAALNYKKQD